MRRVNFDPSHGCQYSGRTSDHPLTHAPLVAVFSSNGEISMTSWNLAMCEGERERESERESE